MKKHFTPQLLTDCFSLGTALVALLVAGIIWREKHYSGQFSQIPPQTTLADLKTQWGEPDCCTTQGTNRVVVFYDRSLLGSYFFTFKDSVLTAKGFND